MAARDKGLYLKALVVRGSNEVKVEVHLILSVRRRNWELGKKEKRKEEQEEEYIFRIRSGKNVCVAKQEEFKRIVKSSPNNFHK